MAIKITAETVKVEVRDFTSLAWRVYCYAPNRDAAEQAVKRARGFYAAVRVTPAQQPSAPLSVRRAA